MAGRHLLTNLMAWSQRPEWQDHYGEMFEEHLGEICDRFDLDFDDIFDLFPESFGTVLNGYIFEDFVTKIFPGNRNLADEYLKRRGWKEKPAIRNYIRALKDSRIRLYEISGIKKDEGFFARDIMEADEPVWVNEKSGIHFLRQWDRVAGRLLNVNGKVQFSGGLLALDAEMVAEVLEVVDLMAEISPADMMKLMTEMTSEADDPDLTAALAELDKGDLALPDIDETESLASLCSSVYVRHCVSRILDPDIPTLVNTDGDPIEWHEVRFPLSKGITQAKLRPVLNTIPGLRMETAKFWNWLQTEKPAMQSNVNDQNIRILTSTMNTGEHVLGNVELEGRDLILTTNSQQRAERGANMLAPFLEGKVGKPVTRIVEPDEGDVTPDEELDLLLDDPQYRDIQIDSINQYYRQLIEQPVPALNNKTPREISKSKKREDIAELVQWIKLLENHLEASPQGSPLREIDISWMWDELGVSPY